MPQALGAGNTPDAIFTENSVFNIVATPLHALGHFFVSFAFYPFNINPSSNTTIASFRRHFKTQCFYLWNCLSAKLSPDLWFHSALSPTSQLDQYLAAFGCLTFLDLKEQLILVEEEGGAANLTCLKILLCTALLAYLSFYSAKIFMESALYISAMINTSLCK